MIFSDLEKSVLVNFKDVSTLINTDHLLDPEIKVENKKIDYLKCLKKQIKIRKMLDSCSMVNQYTKNTNSNDDQNYCLIKKSKCNGCRQMCAYSLAQINKLTSKLVKEELKLHKHPMSRMINKIQRNKEQEKAELLVHYKTMHSL